MKRKKLVRKDRKAAPTLPDIPAALSTDDCIAMGKAVNKSLEYAEKYYREYNEALEQLEIKRLLGQEISAEELDKVEMYKNIKPDVERLVEQANNMRKNLNAVYNALKAEKE